MGELLDATKARRDDRRVYTDENITWVDFRPVRAVRVSPCDRCAFAGLRASAPPRKPETPNRCAAPLLGP